MACPPNRGFNLRPRFAAEKTREKFPAHAGAAMGPAAGKNRKKRGGIRSMGMFHALRKVSA